MDAATRRNLELTETLRGTPAPTLMSRLDRCATGMGSRLLRQWLHHSLRDRVVVTARHEAVERLRGESGDGPYRALHTRLRHVADIERIAGRIALRTARPRDLSGLRESLARMPELQGILAGAGSSRLAELADALAPRPIASRCCTARSRRSPRPWSATAG
jgi:DNA mismatch repair protein MutS